MEGFRKFIKLGDERVNVEEIVSYGIATDEDEDRYLYITLKTVEDAFSYYEDDVDFDLEDKLSEMDRLLLI
ncbi:MAG: hypothetical protein SR1Q5_01965 [Quinella sp. 1Q5]|nr:hypothetical protein [Quinella sp. 1Q5]